MLAVPALEEAKTGRPLRLLRVASQPARITWRVLDHKEIYLGQHLLNNIHGCPHRERGGWLERETKEERLRLTLTRKQIENIKN